MKNYNLYLKSNDWKIKRTKKFTISSKRCAICGKYEDLHIHHLFYRPKLEEAKNTNLRVLCKSCHMHIHFLKKIGKIRYRSKTNHHSRFASEKNAVKYYQYFGFKNYFKATKDDIQQTIEQAKELDRQYSLAVERDK